MPDIILSTLNARYIHSSLGLRYLMANMGELQPQTAIREFILQTRPIDIVETLLQDNPVIVGFSVYIWNVEQTLQVVAMLKQVRPQVIVVLGGPEVSFEADAPPVTGLADYVVTGAADIEFASLCNAINRNKRPLTKFIHAKPQALVNIAYPYHIYSDDDIKNRLIYVEASRGCPFKCEFCLSALDKSVSPFELDDFLDQMQQLYDRGARHFKFVDRTFNLKVDTSIRILNFFLAHLDDELFLHFELIPDHLPEKLKDIIRQFPPGSLQFEIGIQTFNPDVQQLVSRKQNNEKSAENLVWLRNNTHAHIHADLIVGLPGEDIHSFALGFNRLAQLNPHEIQVGILKRLRGSPIIRHTGEFRMIYNPHPPYNVLSTSLIDFLTMQRLVRFARYWDLIANSGRFKHTMAAILGDDPFQRFMQLNDWLFARTGQTHRIALDRLFNLVYQGMTESLGYNETQAQEVLWQDFQLTGYNSRPVFAEQLARNKQSAHNAPGKPKQSKRQGQHLAH